MRDNFHEDLPDNFMKINTFFNCSRFYDEFQSIFSIQLKLKEHLICKFIKLRLN